MPNPFHKARPFIEQIPEKVGGYYNPYIEQGRESNALTNSLYSRLAEHPTDYFNELMDMYYKPSPHFDYQKDLLNRELTGAAAAGGYRGSEEDERRRAEMINALYSQDRQQWLNNIMGMQNLGLEGLEKTNQRGFEASTGYGDILGNVLGNEAQLAYQGQAQKNANKYGLINSGIQAVGNIAGAFLGKPGSGGGGYAPLQAESGGFNYSPYARSPSNYLNFSNTKGVF